MLLHDFIDPRRIAHIAHQADKIQCRKNLFQFLLDRIQREFTGLEQHQPGRRKARDLAAHFRAYRSARAGHHHHLASQQPMQSGIIQHHRVTPQQIVQLDRAQLRHGHFAAHQVIERRHGKRFQPGLIAQLDRALALLVRAGGHRDDHLRYTEPISPFRQAIQRTQHAHSIQGAPMRIGVVIQKTDQPPITVLDQVLGQAGPRISGAQYQHRLSMKLEVAVQTLLFP